MITEQNGKIIVDELIPMSDIPKDGAVVLGFRNGANTFFKLSRYGGKLINGFGMEASAKNFDGWIPMPIYKPKKEDE